MKVFHKLGNFQECSRFAMWIYSIAHNYRPDQMRLGERLPPTTIDAYLEMTLIDKTETLSQQEVVRRFSHAMDSLSCADQTLLLLKYEHELSLKELALRSGLSLSAVKMRL